MFIEGVTASYQSAYTVIGNPQQLYKKCNMANVTGRDHLVISEALIFASEWLASLPRTLDKPSNREDMCTIAEAMCWPQVITVYRSHAQEMLRCAASV